MAAVEVNLTSSKPTAWSGKFSYEISQSISENYSEIKIRVFAKKEDGYTSGTNSGKWVANVTVCGTSKSLSSNGGYALTTGGTWIGSDTGTSTLTFKVYHNGDGSINCNVSITVSPPSGLSWSGETLTYDDSIPVPRIPRSSAISSAGDIYFGDSCQITWTPPASSIYYKLKFSIGSWTGSTGVIAPGTSSAYTYTGYTIPLSAANQIPNTTSVTVNVSLYSYSDYACTSQIGGVSTATFTATLRSSVVPSISTYSAEIDNSENDVVKSWGIALTGYSRVRIKSSASGAYGSSIISFSISTVERGGYIATVPANSGAINYLGQIITSSGDKTFKISCTDSRGRVSSVVTIGTITFTQYTYPRVSKLAMSKTADGTKMVATAIWSYDTVGGKNSLTPQIWFKKTTDEVWSLHSGTPVNQTPFTLSNLTLSELESYNFKVVITDALGNKDEKTSFSSTKKVLLDFQAGGMGLGIGKICEKKNVENGTQSMEVAMDSYFFGDIYVGNEQVPLEDYIRSVMKIVSSEMYGDDYNEVTNPQIGQIYYQKVTS